MKKDSKILIIGHKSPAGAALSQRLKKDGFSGVLTFSPAFDPLDGKSVKSFFVKNKPDYVFLMDVRSGGILANYTYPADLIYSNLQVQNNIIHSAWKTGVRRLLFVASSCSYPKECPQPMREEYLLTGPLEPTSEAFAMAKIAGIKMCQYYNRQYKTRFISVIPATLYGRGDDFKPETSHVIPALISKFHRARLRMAPNAVIWGSGRPRREFLHVADMADAVIFLIDNPKAPELINIGAGFDVSIRELAGLLKGITGFKGRLKFDARKPDGVYRKLLDVHKLKSLGWTAKVGLRAGLEDLYSWYANKGRED